MAESTFDPNVFLNQEVTGSNEVKYSPVPAGEYKAYIDDLGTDQYEQTPILVVTYAILDEALKAELGLEKPTVQDRLFLDMDSSGTLSFGKNKNIKLGRLREACGLNDPAKPFNFNMLRGLGPLNILVEHNFNKKGDGPFANIARVTRGS